MIDASTEGNVPYFIWPDINYFPAKGNGDEDIFWRRFQNGMLWFATPVVSAFGIAGNLLNIAILIRGKLTKSSTWLILALAVADAIYLLGTNNIPIHLYAGEEGQFGFDSRKVPAHALYYVYIVQVVMELSSKIVAMMLPSLITLDRLVAVFFPFRYSRVMTVKRVLGVICLLYVMSATCAVLYSLKFTLSFTSVSRINITATNYQEDESSISNDSYVGLITWSAFYVQNYALHRGLFKAVVYAYCPTPLLFTCFGCLAVGLRIRSQENKRKSLFAFVAQKTQTVKACATFSRCFTKFSSLSSLRTGSSINENSRHNVTLFAVKTTDSVFGRNATTEVNRNRMLSLGADRCAKRGKNKTTRVLLSVCGVYCIANAINFTVVIFFNATNVSTGTAICLETSRKFVLVLNSACNFLFYVGLNQNSRESYRKLFGLFFTRALERA